MRAERLNNAPIITAEMSDTLTERNRVNINGPSLIRVPDWVANPLGRYYLYFAHHGGTFIRLAYANDPGGPYTIHEPGVLPIADTPFTHHIASPDVHVDDANRRLVMYYHGFGGVDTPPRIEQPTMLATSADGLSWQSRAEVLGESYFRVFHLGGWTYAIAKAGRCFRSADGFTDFKEGVGLDRSGRHWAVLVSGETLHLFYSRWGDRPERILYAPIPADPDWSNWKLTERNELLAPELAWEGADEPLAVSLNGSANKPVNELRDPAIFVDTGEQAGRTYLLYSIAGEQGIAIAELHDID